MFRDAAKRDLAPSEAPPAVKPPDVSVPAMIVDAPALLPGSAIDIDTIGRGVLANLDQQPHDVGIGAAVQRSLEGSDRSDDRRVKVGERCGRNPGGERRGIQLVIRMEH